MGMITSEQLELRTILEERVIEPSVPKLKGAGELPVWLVGRSSEDQSSDDVGTHENFMVPKSECRSDRGPCR